MAGDRDRIDDVPHDMEQASDRAHGAHGKGDERETRLDPEPTGPGNEGASQGSGADAAERSTSRLSDAAWGAGAAGGSVVDKRGKKE